MSHRIVMPPPRPANRERDGQVVPDPAAPNPTDLPPSKPAVKVQDPGPGAPSKPPATPAE